MGIYRKLLAVLTGKLQGLSSGSSDALSLQRVGRLCREGHSDLLAQRYEQARSCFLEAVALRDVVHDPATNNYVIQSLASTWLFTEQYQAGIEFLSGYIVRFPGEAGAYRGRAALHWYAGQFEHALKDYSSALIRNPKDIESLSGRGQILADLGRNTEALNSLDAALREISIVPACGPDWLAYDRSAEAFARSGRGLALSGLGRHEEAMKEFEASLAKVADNAWAYQNRARTWEALGQLNGAAVDYQTALEKNGPPLSLFRRNEVRKRLEELGGHSPLKNAP